MTSAQRKRANKKVRKQKRKAEKEAKKKAKASAAAGMCGMLSPTRCQQGSPSSTSSGDSTVSEDRKPSASEGSNRNREDDTSTPQPRLPTTSMKSPPAASIPTDETEEQVIEDIKTPNSTLTRRSTRNRPAPNRSTQTGSNTGNTTPTTAQLPAARNKPKPQQQNRKSKRNQKDFPEGKSD